MAVGWYMLEDYLQRGGVIMLPLVAVSLVMWGMILYCLLQLLTLRGGGHDKITASQIDQWSPAELASRSQGNISATMQLLHSFCQRRTGDADLDGYVVDELVTEVNGTLERGLTLIGVLAAVAPLLGLLGTVLGMINTFNTITLFGTGNARAMAGGISQALITTQTGLLIAIPGLYMRNFIHRRLQNVKHDVISLAMGLKRSLSVSIEGGE
jgi:biopolymer transport protein ExbB